MVNVNKKRVREGGRWSPTSLYVTGNMTEAEKFWDFIVACKVSLLGITKQKQNNN